MVIERFLVFFLKKEKLIKKNLHSKMKECRKQIKV